MPSDPFSRWNWSIFSVTSSSCFASFNSASYSKSMPEFKSSSSQSFFKCLRAHTVWQLPLLTPFFADSFSFNGILKSPPQCLHTWVQKSSLVSGSCFNLRKSIWSNSSIYSMQVDVVPFLVWDNFGRGNFTSLSRVYSSNVAISTSNTFDPSSSIV